jgi:hypothetical protein
LPPPLHLLLLLPSLPPSGREHADHGAVVPLARRSCQAPRNLAPACRQRRVHVRGEPD